MKETKLEIPADCEVYKIETQDGHIVVTFKEKERKLPKSWEEFCDMFPMKLPYNFAIKKQDLYSDDIVFFQSYNNRLIEEMMKFTGDRATAEAVLALCQLIRLRNTYNGDWVPDFTNPTQDKFTIEFCGNKIGCGAAAISNAILYFKSKELRDEFLRYFRPLIEKLKPLYGIKEGGEE